MHKINLVLIAINFLLVTFISVTALSDESYIGVGTELKFKSNAAGGIEFSPCSDDIDSSCADITKVIFDGPMVQVEKICTLRIEKQNVSILAIPKKGTRTLTVKKVKIEENTNNEVHSLMLNGAKKPILFSCVTRQRQNGVTTTSSLIPLTQDLLNGFQEFDFGKIQLEKTTPSSTDSKPQTLPTSKPKSQGSVI